LRFKFWLGIFISAFFLYFFLRKIDWFEVWRILKSVHYFYLLIAVSLYMLIIVLRAQRWRYLLLPLKKIKLSNVFSATIIGFMGNNIFPARLGEIIRAYVIGRREQVSKSASMATIVLERLLDGCTLLIFLIALLWFFPFPPGFKHSKIVNPHNLKIAGLLSGGLYLGIMLFLLAAKLHSQRFLQLLGKLLQPRFSDFHKKLVAVTESFVGGLEGLKRGKHLFPIIAYSLLIWLLIPVTFYALYPAFDLHLSFASSIMLSVVTALLCVIPSSPGFVGTFHFACATCLILLDVEPNKAKSFALIMHAIVFVPVTVLGILYVYQENLNLKELNSLEKEVSIE
jgi:uncharacterized protein (TIRG00374 family)